MAEKEKFEGIDEEIVQIKADRIKELSDELVEIIKIFNKIVASCSDLATVYEIAKIGEREIDAFNENCELIDMFTTLLAASVSRQLSNDEDLTDDLSTESIKYVN